jgi:hypothetical protein
MYSSRYGWVPDVEKLNSELKEKYKWIPNTSITFMEFMHGAIKSMNRNSCFFIRTIESLTSIPDAYANKFFDFDKNGLDQLSKAHLQV